MMTDMVLNGVERLGDAFILSKNMILRYQEDIGYGIALIGDPALYVGKRFDIVPEEGVAEGEGFSG